MLLRSVRTIACVSALACCLLAPLANSRPAAMSTSHGPLLVLIIRHSEKTGEDGDVHLSRKGVERSAVLDRLFIASKDRPEPFPRPDFIIAACNGKSSNRPVETVTQLAEKLKLSIDTTYDSKLLPDP